MAQSKVKKAEVMKEVVGQPIDSHGEQDASVKQWVSFYFGFSNASEFR